MLLINGHIITAYLFIRYLDNEIEKQKRIIHNHYDN
jgi:hypothetical protein